jgi:hypothetical protein
MTTYEDEVEVRRTSVGTKVLVFAIAILAALGSFWAIVWFIRSYVEPPRVMLPAPMILAARESTPVPPPARKAEPKAEEPALTGSITAEAKPKPVAPIAPAPPAPVAPREAAEPSASNAVADRWAPINQFGTPVLAPPPPAVAMPPAPLPAEPPSTSAPAALATGPAENEPQEVAEGSVPAIEGPAPLPRRKPAQTAAVKRSNDPPLPRPRPDGPAPQSVWTAVPTADDRFPPQ